MSTIEEYIRSEVNKQVILDICEQLNFNVLDRKGKKVKLDRLRLNFTESKYLFLYEPKSFWSFNKDKSPVVFLEVVRNLKPVRCVIVARDRASAYRVKGVVDEELSYTSGEPCSSKIIVEDVPIISIEEMIKGYRL